MAGTGTGLKFSSWTEFATMGTFLVTIFGLISIATERNIESKIEATNTKIEATNTKIDSVKVEMSVKFDAMNTKIDSMFARTQDAISSTNADVIDKAKAVAHEEILKNVKKGWL